MSKYVVSAMYKFVALENFEQIRQPLLSVMEENEICGTLLIAAEGLNGTVAGSQQAIDNLFAWFNQDERLQNISHKESFTEDKPFKRCKVKLKKEIVTMGVEGIDPRHVVGTYVKPTDWNALIADPEVFVVDTRNDYEIEIGTFENAVDPNTKTFREFPDYVKENMDPAKHKKVAMFCTGGIRCEKSTAYMKEQGFEEVYHLEGGILKYLEEVPEEETMWKGECFVFDDRVTVDHQLNAGQYDQCHACRMPILEEDKAKNEYAKGISCHHCFDKTTPEQRSRYAERERQMELAKQRGEAHVGTDAAKILLKRREEKKARLEVQQASAKK